MFVAFIVCSGQFAVGLALRQGRKGQWRRECDNAGSAQSRQQKSGSVCSLFSFSARMIDHLRIASGWSASALIAGRYKA
jgi:hypothetical protein